MPIPIELMRGINHAIGGGQPVNPSGQGKARPTTEKRLVMLGYKRNLPQDGPGIVRSTPRAEQRRDIALSEDYISLLIDTVP